MQKSPDAITRAVIAQPVTGAVWDAGGRDVLGSWQLSTREEYFQHGAGSDALQLREHTGIIDAVPEDLSDGIKVMRNQGCPVVAIILSWNRHTLWLEESDLNTVPQRRGAGQLATEQIVLANRITFGHVYQSQNLLADFPWHCAQVKALYEDDQAPETVTGYRLYRGNSDTDLGWKVTGMSGEPSVSMAGVLDAQGGQAVLEFIFPVPFSRVVLSGTGVLEALAWDGSTLSTAVPGQEIQVPQLTWKLRVTVFDGADQPRLHITEVGSPVGYREGACNDCDDPEEIIPPWALNDLPWMEPQNILVADAAPLICDISDVQVIDGNGDPWMEPQNIAVLETDGLSDIDCNMDDVLLEFQPNDQLWMEPQNVLIVDDATSDTNAPPTIAFGGDTSGWPDGFSSTTYAIFEDPDGDDLDYVEVVITPENSVITSWVAEGWNGSQWVSIPAQTPGGAGPLRIYNTTPGYSKKRITWTGFVPTNYTGTALIADAEARDVKGAETVSSLTIPVT